MSLAKLTIEYETTHEGSFDGEVEVLFNPNKLSYQRSLSWQTVDPAGGAVSGRRGRLQFQSIVPETLSLELFFDTYELSNKPAGLLSLVAQSLPTPLPSTPPTPINVLTYTRKIEVLASIAKELHRPPVCKLMWGVGGGGTIRGGALSGLAAPAALFTGVLTQMSKTLELFHKDGTPLRATMQCTFTDATFTGELNSPDVSKTYVVQPLDNLLGIASAFYGDHGLWRVIAEANGIDDPLSQLTPGLTLAIPPIR